MTCKDCIHYEACNAMGRTVEFAVDDGVCKEFEDKSLYIKLPCKIGDGVWAIRNYRGVKSRQYTVVSDMFFTDDMRLMIVAKYVARGEWGKTVFATYKEAEAAVKEREK